MVVSAAAAAGVPAAVLLLSLALAASLFELLMAPASIFVAVLPLFVPLLLASRSVSLMISVEYMLYSWSILFKSSKVLGFSDRINVLKLLDLAISNGNLFSMRNETKFF